MVSIVNSRLFFWLFLVRQLCLRSWPWASFIMRYSKTVVVESLFFMFVPNTRYCHDEFIMRG